jgi:flagellar capping protein FliD
MASAIRRAEISYAPIGQGGSESLGEGAGAQSFKIGQMLKLSSGQLVVTGNNQDNEKLAGIAEQDACGTQGTATSYTPITMGMEIRLSCYHSNAALAVATAADIGKHVQIVQSSNKTVADVATFDADPSKSPFIIKKLEGSDDAEQYRRIIVAPKATHLAFQGEAEA